MITKQYLLFFIFCIFTILVFTDGKSIIYNSFENEKTSPMIDVKSSINSMVQNELFHHSQPEYVIYYIIYFS
jgi:hypothetical protein